VQTKKALTEVTRREFQTQLKDVDALAEGGRGTGTGASAATPPTFDGTISWVVFLRQFETVAEYTAERAWRNPHN
jgi:hypothetical protein